VPARLINIKYITIRAEKVGSPVTALHSVHNLQQLFVCLVMIVHVIVKATKSFSTTPVLHSVH